MKDPDDHWDADVCSESSEEYENWDQIDDESLARNQFDFVKKAKERFGNILKEQPKQRKLTKHPTVKD